MGGPKFTIGEKRNYDKDSGVPAPGTYDANDKAVKARSPSAQIRGGDRADIVGKEARGRVGPGQYDSPSRMGGPRYTIGEKREQSPDNKNPGPGAFNPNDSITKARVPAAQMRGSERADLVGREARQNVGPGHYDSPSKAGGPAFTIGTKSDLRNTNHNPAPGQYEANDSLTRPRSPSPQMCKSAKGFNLANQRNMVGPGQYDPKMGPGGPAFTIGEKRDNSIGNCAPGPGTYNGTDGLTKAQSPSF